MDRQFIQGFLEYGLGAAFVVLSLVAAVSVVSSRIHQPMAKVLWVAFVLIVPVAGAVLWFFIGREGAEERQRPRAASG